VAADSPIEVLLEPPAATRAAEARPRPVETPAISIVIPVYNEVEALPDLLLELSSALARTGRSHEVILVDDASTDASAQWMATAARERPELFVLALDRHEGQSAALAAGFARAHGEIVITMDADGQNDPADLLRVLEALDSADVVSGIRETRRDPWRRRVSSRIANSVRRSVLGDHVTDIGCSLKGYRRAALEGLPMFRGAHRYLPALCEMRGAKLVEIPVAHRPRRYGQSKYGVADRLWAGLADLAGVLWLRSRLHRSRAREVGHESR